MKNKALPITHGSNYWGWFGRCRIFTTFNLVFNGGYGRWLLTPQHFKPSTVVCHKDARTKRQSVPDWPSCKQKSRDKNRHGELTKSKPGKRIAWGRTSVDRQWFSNRQLRSNNGSALPWLKKIMILRKDILEKRTEQEFFTVREQIKSRGNAMKKTEKHND